MDPFRLNGKVFDHGSVIIRIGGERYEGITGAKYDQKRIRTKVTGLNRHRRPKGRTRGNYEAGDATFTAYRATAQAIRDQIARLSSDGASYGDPEVPILIQYVEPGLAPIKDELVKCCIITDAGGTDDNADPLKEDVVFSVLSMKRNGKTLYGAR